MSWLTDQALQEAIERGKQTNVLDLLDELDRIDRDDQHEFGVNW